MRLAVLLQAAVLSRVDELSQEFYVKTLVGTKHGAVGREAWTIVDDADLELAKARLVNFDVVLIMEWLGHPTVQAYLDRVLGVQDPESVNKILKHTKNTHMDDMMKLNEVERQLMSRMTIYDLELYRFAQLLLVTRMRRAGFVDFEPVASWWNHTGALPDVDAMYEANLSPAGRLKSMFNSDSMANAANA